MMTTLPGAASASPTRTRRVAPLFVSSEIVTGENRFLVGLINQNDAPVASPAIDIGVEFFDLADSETDPVFSIDTEFVWTVKPLRGLWIGKADFPNAGEWGAEVTVNGAGFDEKVTGTFIVKKESATPAIGDPRQPSDTPTADDADDLSEISTDAKPDPRFYQLSVADAVSSGKPFVLTFATPKFCTSKVCGPTLDIVKKVAPDYPDMNFIHVEPFDLVAVEQGEFEPVPSVDEWGLPTEPWVFIVDSKGNVAAKFEGTLSPTGAESTRSTRCSSGVVDAQSEQAAVSLVELDNERARRCPGVFRDG